MKDEKTFLDTNILVYAHDKTSGRKHKISRGIVMDLWNTGSGILSVQVLQELYIILTKKIPVLVKPAIAKEIISSLLSNSRLKCSPAVGGNRDTAKIQVFFLGFTDYRCRNTRGRNNTFFRGYERRRYHQERYHKESLPMMLSLFSK